MKKILYGVLILLTVLNSLLLPGDLVLVWLCCWAMFVDDRDALIAAAIGGLLFDLISLNTLGLHSIALLVAVTLLLLLLRLALFPPKFFVIAGYVFVTIIAYILVLTLLTIGTVSLANLVPSLLIDGVIMLIVLVYMRGHFERLYKKPLRLRA